MPSREVYVVKRGKMRSGWRTKKDAAQKGSLFSSVLGLNISSSIPPLPLTGNKSDPSSKGSGSLFNRAPAPPKPKSPASTFWQPIRSILCPFTAHIAGAPGHPEGERLNAQVRKSTQLQGENPHALIISVCVCEL